MNETEKTITNDYQNIIAEELKKVSSSKKVNVKFNKLVGNIHATSEVMDAITHLIRFSEERKKKNPYDVGKSLPYEENEKATMFLSKFEQPICFAPGVSYMLPVDEAKKYKKKYGTYKEIYTKEPAFFRTEEEYERALDIKEFVEIMA